MNMHTAARLFLLSYPGIYEKVNQRIFWLKKPEGMKETHIYFFRVSNPKNSRINSYSPRFQFSVFSQSGSEALELAGLIEKAFDRFKGTMGDDIELTLLGQTSYYAGNGKPIKQAVYENTQEFYEEDTGLYHVPVDVIFHYVEEN
ncbi:MAG: hypothetical protein ACOCRU_03030 [bacterium]